MVWEKHLKNFLALEYRVTFILYRMTIKNTVYLTLNYQTLRILVCHVKTCLKRFYFLKFDS